MKNSRQFACIAGANIAVLCTIAAATSGSAKVISAIPDFDPEGQDRLFIVGDRLRRGSRIRASLGGINLVVLVTERELMVVELPENFPDGSYSFSANDGSGQ